jgi:hypothetical protein
MLHADAADYTTALTKLPIDLGFGPNPYEDVRYTIGTASYRGNICFCYSFTPLSATRNDATQQYMSTAGRISVAKA